MQNNNITFKKITTRVRAPRIVVFINSTDGSWMQTSQRAIEWLSQLWGGGFDIIVPTDGKTIAPIFWEILESYKPDYLVRYIKTTKDIALQETVVDKQIIAQATENFKRGHPNFSKEDSMNAVVRSFRDYAQDTDTFEFSSELKKELVERLNPFHSSEGTAVSFFRCGTKSDGETLNIRHLLSDLPASDNEIADYDLSSFPAEFQLMLRTTLGSGAVLKEPLDDDRFRNNNSSGTYTPNVTFKKLTDCYEAYSLTKNLGQAVRSPFSRSLLGLGYYNRWKPYNIKGQPVIVIIGSSLEDYALYYCLSKISRDIYWIPDIFMAGNVDSIKNLFMHITGAINGDVFSTEYEGREVHLTSSSKTVEDLNETIRAIVDQGLQYGSERDTHFEIKVPFSLEQVDTINLMFEAGNVYNMHIQQFVNNISANILSTPKPLSFKTFNAFESKWLVDLEIDAAEAFPGESGYTLPANKIFAKDFFFNPHNYIADESMIRFTGECISFYCPTLGLVRGTDTVDEILVKPLIHLLSPFDIFGRLFADAGYTIETSDKGNFMRASIELFGSLDTLALEFKDEKILRLFDNLRLPAKKDGSGGVFINKRCFMCYGDVQKILGSDDTITRAKIDEYVSKRLLTRGYIFKCDNCLNCDWYSIGEITDKFTCRRCSSQQVYIQRHWRMGNEPPVYYNLHEVFYQGLTHNMIAPVLSLAYLKKQSKRSFIYIPEVRATSKATPDNSFEIDILCIQDGKIIIGESKINDGLENKPLSDYLTVCKLMRGTFLFATTGSSFAKSKGKVERSSLGQNPIFLKDTDLFK